MLTLKIVPNTHIQQTWPEVEQMLNSALQHSAGEYDINHLKVMLVKNMQTLLVGVDEKNIIRCALTIEWINHPNDRIAFITSIGGETCHNGWSEFINWAKANGCTKIQGATYESAARLFKHKYGFKNIYIIMEKQI